MRNKKAVPGGLAGHESASPRAVANKLQFETELWRKGLVHVAGVDEAGRGPLAGPVVAAAVILNENQTRNLPITIDDSKKLSEKQRINAYKWIVKQAAAYGVGIVEAAEIDRVNIARAAACAMLKAIRHLGILPQHVLVDGYAIADPPCPQTALIRGDSRSLSIAAASIVAKVVRDEIMKEYHQAYPPYDFIKNKGYGTKKHIQAIAEFGLCPIHRRSFRPRRLEKSGIYDP